MQSLWDDAVEFIEGNESRIRVETQVIQGEEYTVWRWLQVCMTCIFLFPVDILIVTLSQLKF